MGGADFSSRFRGIIVRHRRVGCGLGVMRQSACLMVGPVALFNCTPVDQASDCHMFLVRFQLLRGHLLENGCLHGWPYVLFVF